MIWASSKTERQLGKKKLVNMAARKEEIQSTSCRPVFSSRAKHFQDFVQEIVPKFTEENLKAMKRFMADVISLKIGVECESAGELLAELSKYHCINEHDLDLLEDMLGVAGRNEILDLLNRFKKKCPSSLESVSSEAVEKLIPGKVHLPLTCYIVLSKF